MTPEDIAKRREAILLNALHVITELAESRREEIARSEGIYEALNQRVEAESRSKATTETLDRIIAEVAVELGREPHEVSALAGVQAIIAKAAEEREKARRVAVCAGEWVPWLENYLKVMDPNATNRKILVARLDRLRAELGLLDGDHQDPPYDEALGLKA